MFKINRQATHFHIFVVPLGRAVTLGRAFCGLPSLPAVAVVGSLSHKRLTTCGLASPFSETLLWGPLHLASTLVECCHWRGDPAPANTLPAMFRAAVAALSRMPTYRKVAIVGVGLIGGSIGLALRQRGLSQRVVGIGRRQSSLDKALVCQAIDETATDLEKGVDGAELVVVATPVAAIADHVCQAVAATPEDVVVTDAGSTKAAICAAVESRLQSAARRFVGSHPLAGDHRSGPAHARGDLFEGKTVVVTPTESTQIETIAKVEAFWQNLGARVTKLSPSEHDEALAATSHLPHLLASALAVATPAEWLPLAATGWADTTRVAAGDPELWTQVLAQNKPAVLAALDRLSEQLEKLQSDLQDENWSALRETLENGKRIRDALGN